MASESDNKASEVIQQSIVKFQIADDVSIEDAIDSMQLRANMLNFKQVADLPLVRTGCGNGRRSELHAYTRFL